MAHPDDGSLLVFDGDCGICSRLAALTRRLVLPPGRGHVEPYQRLDLARYGLTREACGEALQFVTPGGRVYAAQDAVARVLLAGRVGWRPFGRLLTLPGVNAVAGAGYRWVARNRYRLPGGTPACALPPRPPEG